MSSERLINTLRQSVEEELRLAVDQVVDRDLSDLRGMIHYHMGWEGENVGSETTGKRIRPLLVLLVTAAYGSDWNKALPAAVAVELVHNFSLIHDDIQDNSPLRRGRPTVWKIWGIPQAINTGDTILTLAHLALFQLEKTASKEITIKAARLLQDTCLKLTEGQHLDIAYQDRSDLSIEDYWPMVDKKTAALLSTCTGMGALVAGADENRLEGYQRFGHLLGLAYQTLDDLLGIWGETEITGKSTDSDLFTGKKSLPILYGLNQRGVFAIRWVQGGIKPDEVPALAKQLEVEGAKAFTQDTAARLTQQALEALEKAHPQGEAGDVLTSLTFTLLKRKA